MNNKIKQLLFKNNIKIEQNIPRHSTLFAYEYFKTKKIDVIEIGTEFGINANDILKRLNVRKIFLIDPYITYSSQKVKRNLVNCERKAKLLLKKYKNIIWVKETSINALKFVEKADFIYIDGNHGYNFAKDDVFNYYNKLKEEGIMAGHDINNYHGVTRALMEFIKEKNIKPKDIYISGNDWWIIKRKKINNE